MKQSLTYYITLFVIRFKGLKKTFSKDPIDFQKIRKEDVYYPKGSFFKPGQTHLTSKLVYVMVFKQKRMPQTTHLSLQSSGG